MLSYRIPLWAADEYTYPVDGNFIPFLMTCLHEDETVRPALLVVPGGSYRHVTPAEGEIAARRFCDKGYNTFVITYTTNRLMKVPLRLQPLRDLSRAVVLIRKQADRLHVDRNALAVCGFSAGGHLCSCLCVHFNAPQLAETGVYAGISNRPDMAVLAYPVITCGRLTHRDSVLALLGPDASRAEIQYMSSELCVTADTPPAFLWTTMTDQAVPYENSVLYAQALSAAGVPAELHVFGNGPHGMSLGDEIWAREGRKAFYTLEQFFNTLQYHVDHGLPLDQLRIIPFDRAGEIPAGTDVRQLYMTLLGQVEPGVPDAAVASWPDLADIWMQKQRAGHSWPAHCS